MTTNLESMLAFALLHDWGFGARIKSDALVLIEDGSEIEFRSLRDLRDWAGY